MLVRGDMATWKLLCHSPAILVEVVVGTGSCIGGWLASSALLKTGWLEQIEDCCSLSAGVEPASHFLDQLAE